MASKTIRVIAPLPPNGCASAVQARDVIYHLSKAGHEVLPSSTIKPAYSPDILRFSPKRLYEPDRLRLTTGEIDTFILYPEGLDFAQVRQKLWKHRRLEEWRRIRLAWGGLKNSRHGVVVYCPSKLWQWKHLAFVLMAVGQKIRHPGKTTLRAQPAGAEAVVQPILGYRPAPCPAEEADLENIRLAARHGAGGLIRLTPIWLRSALGRLDPASRLGRDIAGISAVIEAFGEARLPAFQSPKGEVVTQAFVDKIDMPPSISRFMLHLRAARRLEERFPLDSGASRRAYAKWYLDHAPETVGHALPLPKSGRLIQANDSANSRADALHRIKKYARFFNTAKYVDPALRRWLQEKTGGLENGLTRLELLVAVLAHAPVQDIAALRSPWENDALKRWFKRLALSGYPMLAELSGLALPATPPKISVTGNSDAKTGLGQNRKMSIEALTGLIPEKPVFLHHVNADAIPQQMLTHHRAGAFHIGFLLWEMQEVPQSHRLAGDLLDDIWVPSRYVQSLYQTAYGRPVTWVGKGFDLPKAEPFDLASLGISPDQQVFLTCFDIHSSVARKNPLAAVLAFQMAFEGQKDVRLIVKTTPKADRHWGDPEQQLDIIRRIAAKDRRIILWQAYLPFAQFLGMISAATALVSPHRAEGFGYLPAYAMKLGTPVIATDYSGTQDFCTDKTAFPVRWRQRNVRAGEAIYPMEKAFWAEVDHEDLARTMQQVLTNTAARQTRAAAGRELMLRRYSAKALRMRYELRLTELGLI